MQLSRAFKIATKFVKEALQCYWERTQHIVVPAEIR